MFKYNFLHYTLCLQQKKSLFNNFVDRKISTDLIGGHLFRPAQGITDCLGRL